MRENSCIYSHLSVTRFMFCNGCEGFFFLVGVSFQSLVPKCENSCYYLPGNVWCLF